MDHKRKLERQAEVDDSRDPDEDKNGNGMIREPRSKKKRHTDPKVEDELDLWDEFKMQFAAGREDRRIRGKIQQSI